MEHHFNIEDAKRYGLAEATILYNLRFWVDKNKANNKHFYDGFYWTYNSVKAFESQFPYLTKDQIRRCLDRLEDMGAIKSSNYNSTPYDKTKWYCVLSQIDLANLPNGDGENAKPIPYSKQDEKQDNNIQARKKSKKKDTEIPTFDMFEKYALEKKPEVNLLELKRKYDSWIMNDWHDGNGAKIVSWTSKLNNTLPYIKENVSKPLLPVREKTRDDFWNESQYKDYCLKNNLEYKTNE